MKIQKFEYLENKRSFLDEIKSTFHSFWRAFIWWKNRNLMKIVDTSYKAYFFWIESPIKMKLSQIQVCCMTNIFNMFLAQCWKLETSSRPFYDFIKMKIEQDLVIFNSQNLPFLIVHYSHFQESETLESWHCYWVIWADCWKGPGT